MPIRRDSRVLFDRTWEPQAHDYVALYRRQDAPDEELLARDVVAFGVDQMGAFHALVWCDDFRDFAAADEIPGLVTVDRVDEDGDDEVLPVPPQLEPPGGNGLSLGTIPGHEPAGILTRDEK